MLADLHPAGCRAPPVDSRRGLGIGPAAPGVSTPGRKEQGSLHERLTLSRRGTEGFSLRLTK
jgi:hypothetical protein